MFNGSIPIVLDSLKQVSGTHQLNYSSQNMRRQIIPVLMLYKVVQLRFRLNFFVVVSTTSSTETAKCFATF